MVDTGIKGIEKLSPSGRKFVEEQFRISGADVAQQAYNTVFFREKLEAAKARGDEGDIRRFEGELQRADRQFSLKKQQAGGRSVPKEQRARDVLRSAEQTDSEFKPLTAAQRKRLNVQLEKDRQKREEKERASLSVTTKTQTVSLAGQRPGRPDRVILAEIIEKDTGRVVQRGGIFNTEEQALQAQRILEGSNPLRNRAILEEGLPTTPLDTARFILKENAIPIFGNTLLRQDKVGSIQQATTIAGVSFSAERALKQITISTLRTIQSTEDPELAEKRFTQRSFVTADKMLKRKVSFSEDDLTKFENINKTVFKGKVLESETSGQRVQAAVDKSLESKAIIKPLPAIDFIAGISKELDIGVGNITNVTLGTSRQDPGTITKLIPNNIWRGRVIGAGTTIAKFESFFLSIPFIGRELFKQTPKGIVLFSQVSADPIGSFKKAQPIIAQSVTSAKEFARLNPGLVQGSIIGAGFSILRPRGLGLKAKAPATANETVKRVLRGKIKGKVRIIQPIGVNLGLGLKGPKVTTVLAILTKKKFTVIAIKTPASLGANVGLTARALMAKIPENIRIGMATRATRPDIVFKISKVRPPRADFVLRISRITRPELKGTLFRGKGFVGIGKDVFNKFVGFKVSVSRLGQPLYTRSVLFKGLPRGLKLTIPKPGFSIIRRNIKVIKKVPLLSKDLEAFSPFPRTFVNKAFIVRRIEGVEFYLGSKRSLTFLRPQLKFIIPKLSQLPKENLLFKKGLTLRFPKLGRVIRRDTVGFKDIFTAQQGPRFRLAKQVGGLTRFNFKRLGIVSDKIIGVEFFLGKTKSFKIIPSNIIQKVPKFAKAQLKKLGIERYKLRIGFTREPVQQIKPVKEMIFGRTIGTQQVTSRFKRFEFVILKESGDKLIPKFSLNVLGPSANKAVPFLSGKRPPIIIRIPKPGIELIRRDVISTKFSSFYQNRVARSLGLETTVVKEVSTLNKVIGARFFFGKKSVSIVPRIQFPKYPGAILRKKIKSLVPKIPKREIDVVVKFDAANMGPRQFEFAQLNNRFFRGRFGYTAPRSIPPTYSTDVATKSFRTRFNRPLNKVKQPKQIGFERLRVEETLDEVIVTDALTNTQLFSAKVVGKGSKGTVNLLKKMKARKIFKSFQVKDPPVEKAVKGGEGTILIQKVKTKAVLKPKQPGGRGQRSKELDRVLNPPRVDSVLDKFLPAPPKQPDLGGLGLGQFGKLGGMKSLTKLKSGVDLGKLGRIDVDDIIKGKQKGKQRTSTKLKQRVDIRADLRQRAGIDSVSLLKSGTISGQRQRQRQETRQDREIIEKVPPPPVPVPIIIPGIKIPPLEPQRKKKKRRRGTRPLQYQSSIAARYLGITAPKIPKIVTGLGIRPIITRR